MNTIKIDHNYSRPLDQESKIVNTEYQEDAVLAFQKQLEEAKNKKENHMMNDSRGRKADLESREKVNTEKEKKRAEEENKAHGLHLVARQEFMSVRIDKIFESIGINQEKFLEIVNKTVEIIRAETNGKNMTIKVKEDLLPLTEIKISANGKIDITTRHIDSLQTITYFKDQIQMRLGSEIVININDEIHDHSDRSDGETGGESEDAPDAGQGDRYA